MAINLIAKVQDITPAYNPIKFIYDSTNNAEAGFKYIFDIYEAGGGAKIAEYRVLPNIDGYGEVDLSRLLQNYVSYDFDPTSTTYFDATNSYYKYDVKVGEEYVQTYNYTSNLTQNGTLVQVNYASQPFSVGDQVQITPDTPASNPNLEGLFTVTEANANDFTVNSLWSEIGDATDNGSFQFADNRKSVTRDIITSIDNYVFNGALPFADFRTYDKDDYQMVAIGAQTDKLLLTMPQDFTMTPEQDLWLNMMQDVNANANVYFENSDGDILYKATPSTELINQVAVGANNHGTLLVDTGSLPLVKSTTEWYDVWSTSFNAQRSLKYRIYIDRRCKINDYEIVFLDRMGSIGSFSFQLRDKLTGKVTKESYNQDIAGSVVSSEWTYSSDEQGMRVINPRIKETYELNTNWMDENDSDYFTQLVSSPQTWIKIDGSYYSCIVETTNYEKQRQRNRNLIRKSISVSLSVQDVING